MLIDKTYDLLHTQYVDIAAELSHYSSQFKDKVIYLNCDNADVSNFWQYFVSIAEGLGYRRLLCTYYQPNGVAELAEFVLTDHGYKEWRHPLSGDGDFRSEECLQFLDEADVVITHPPYSLFKEYVELLLAKQKQFLILGLTEVVTHQDIFKYLQSNKFWLGANDTCGTRNGNTLTFHVPETSQTKSKELQVPAWWFTNLDVKNRHVDLLLEEFYSPVLHPVNVNGVLEIEVLSDIPCDYYGVLSVPLLFLLRYNPDQFELIGLAMKSKPDILCMLRHAFEYRVLIRRKFG